MYISKKELRRIARDHELRGWVNYTKPQLFDLHVHFHASSDLLMVCRTMQLRFLNLGTVLTYAFKQKNKTKNK